MATNITIEASVMVERPAMVCMSDQRLQAFLAEQPDWLNHGVYRCSAAPPGVPEVYVVMETAARALVCFEVQRGWITPAQARAAERQWKGRA